MKHESVLKRLLRRESHEDLVETILRPEKVFQKKAKRAPGRPKVEKTKKARNFTLCLAPQFVEFIDKMVVKDPKVKGRGRKIRFIIERFLEHEKRSLTHIRIMRESLKEVDKTLQSFGGRVKTGEKLQLSTREKDLISKAVDQVHMLLKILAYSPKTLQRILSRDEWALLSFCLNWKTNRGVVI